MLLLYFKVKHKSTFGQLLPLLVVTLINILIMEMFRVGYKKRRGAKFLSIAYLYNQALALPLPKDKQTKALPTPSDIINPLRPNHPNIYIPRYTPPMGSYTLFIYIRKKDVGEYKIHPRERFVASPL